MPLPFLRFTSSLWLRLLLGPGARRKENHEGDHTMRAVADTNVLLAGLRSRVGASHELLRLLSQRHWILVLSNTLLTEYQEILHCEQAQLPYTHEEIERLLDGLCSRNEKIRLRSSWWPVLEDADDEMMVQLAVESRPDYLVTHNVRHLQPRKNNRNIVCEKSLLWYSHPPRKQGSVRASQAQKMAH
jgi:putative PIN family toxin of toxin-antitoxin system